MNQISGMRVRHVRKQQGMSLVELLVGVTIGLFIVAAASLMAANHLTDNRRLLLETQLQQDMRASMDIMSRQIRRIGSHTPEGSLSLLGEAGFAPGKYDKEYTNVHFNNDRSSIRFDYYLNLLSQDDLSEGGGVTNWGFKLENGRIRTHLTRRNGGWQDLTDFNAVRVDQLTFTPLSLDSEVFPCPKLCPDGTKNCWPKSAVRAFQITMTARSAKDPLVVRTMQSTVRLRNNLPVFFGNSSNQPCPA